MNNPFSDSDILYLYIFIILGCKNRWIRLQVILLSSRNSSCGARRPQKRFSVTLNNAYHDLVTIYNTRKLENKSVNCMWLFMLFSYDIQKCSKKDICHISQIFELLWICKNIKIYSDDHACAIIVHNLLLRILKTWICDMMSFTCSVVPQVDLADTTSAVATERPVAQMTSAESPS